MTAGLPGVVGTALDEHVAGVELGLTHFHHRVHFTLKNNSVISGLGFVHTRRFGVGIVRAAAAHLVERFADIVAAAGYTAPVRSPRGRDIMAACGQLKSASVKTARRERKTAQAAPV